ncbi:MAG: SDR family oxidoreductase, partial [Bacteroidota bacterium]
MANYLIIAATSDIGAQVAEKLTQQGHNLWLTARKDTIGTLASKPDTQHSVLDATDFDAVDQTFEVAKKALGGLDGV